MFYNPLEQFEIYSVFSFIFGNLDFSITNACLNLVFGQEEIEIGFDIEKVIIGTIFGCSIAYILTKIFKKSKSNNTRHYLMLHTGQVSIKQIVHMLKKKHNTFFSRLIDYSVIFSKNKGFLIYFTVWHWKLWKLNSIDPSAIYQYPNEEQTLLMLVSLIPDKMMEKIRVGTDNKYEVLISSSKLRKKIIIYYDIYDDYIFDQFHNS
jgi:hypothetical protein